MSVTARKNKKRINAVDVVIILLVLALIATAVYRICDEVTKNISSKQSKCILTFECTVTNEGILDYLKDGEAVYLSKDGTLIGVFYDETADDGKGAVYKVVDGNSENSSSGAFVLRGSIKMSADAHKAQGGEYYVINGTNITEGGTLAIYTEKAVLNVVVKSFSELK